MQCLAQAAREGDDTALCRLGLAYMKGDGVPKDYRQAYRNFLAGANRHNAKCQFNLGLCYANGDGVLRCGMMAAQCYQQAAHQELPEAQNNLGECYMTGNGVQQNKDKGMWWKKQASDRGLAEAQYSIGLVYLHGHIGVEKNVAVAMKYLKLAEKQKHPKAIAIISQIKKQEQHKQKELNYERSLDDFFEEDRITPKLTLSDENRKQAFDHVRDAAAEGVIDAQWHFAKLIDEGVIHKKAGKADIKRAAAEYTKAAKGKHTESLNRLGEILLTIGWDEHQLDKHWAEAIRNFTLAANAGHVEAMYNLGEAWMARGFSGEDDDPELFPVNHAAVDKAVGWFVKAAEHGHQASQYNLGVLYQDGLRAERRVFEGDQVDGGNAVVEVSSRITFDADYDSILSSDFARSEFEAEFRLSMAAALGDGRSIRSEQVLIQDIHHGSIIVEFWLEVPPEEAERVVGLVNELRQSDAAVALHVGRRRLAANTATISKPFKRAGPVLALMNEIEAEKEKLAADDAEAEEVQSQLLFEMQANRLAQAVREKRQLDGSSSAAVERESHVALDSHVITAAHARLGNAMGENALAELEARYTNAQQRLKGKALQTELANLDAAKDMLLVRDLHLLLAACYFTKSQLHLCVGSCADLATCWSRRGTAARGYASRLRNGLGSTACRLVKEGSRSCSRV